jgi:hypothetical protein
VEKELAKRSHFCQKVIKRLKLQVKELEEDKRMGARSPMNRSNTALGRNNAKQKYGT